MSKLKVTTISDPDNDNTAITVDSSGNITVAQNATFSGSVTGISSYSDSDVLDLFNVTDTNPVYACRAWVNFDGTGTVAIRASGNVSSITDNGTGIYTINFTNAMPDINYSVTGVTQGGDAAILFIKASAVGGTTPLTTTAVPIALNFHNGVYYDTSTVTVAIFR